MNASLNGVSTVLLILALIFIKKGNYRAHGYTMVATLFSSVLFLISYVTKSLVYGEVSSGIPKGGFKTFYFAVFLTHVPLAILMVPFILLALFLAWRRNWALHRRIARPTYFAWLYVSITGILMYFILFRWYPALYPSEFHASPLFST